MAQMVYPSNRMQSVTAAPGFGDAHDGMVYSAGLLQHGGAPAPLKLFTVQYGQAIPNAKGAAVAATTNTWQTTYSLTTTNLDRPSQLGDNLGDATFRAIGITIEKASFVSSTGAASAYGATNVEVEEILSKCAGELKIGNKPQMQGPVWAYPALGGAFGTLSTTANAATVGLVSNGAIPIGREFRTPMLCGRYDSLVFEVSIASGSTLAFSVTTADGQPTLLWVMINVDFMSDVR